MTAPEAVDAVVIGAGPNGLTAANLLADAGWSVEVWEEQPTLGGAVRSDREVHEDFVHDTFSAFYPLAAASPTLGSLGLEQHGLEWVHAPAVLGHPMPDGAWGILSRDRERTASLAEEAHAGDGEAWLDLCRRWDAVGDDLVEALLSPFPPVRATLRGLAHVRRAGGLEFVRDLLTPAVDLGLQRFGGRGPQLLLAGNAGHADIPLHAPGSGLMGVLMTMLGQTVGFPVPRGGAGRLTQALADRLTARGGVVRCERRVAHVEIENGTAVGVRAADGERQRVRRAVVAAVTAPHLYGGLVRAEDLPRRVVRGMRQFQIDPGTVKVDWALSGPVPWDAPPPEAPGTVHVADDVQDMATALASVASGVLPARPFLLTGQMTTSDPTRSPAGTESMWAYTHVPQRVREDAGDDGITGAWDESELERFADRMQDRFERLAPGFGSRVLARRVLGPVELERRDANLIGGAINGGTSQLQQQLFLRPVPGSGRAETGLRNLYLASASAHPGGGVHGAPGSNAARAAIAHARIPLRRR